MGKAPIPGNALVSYAYYRDYDLDRLQHLRLIGDSGAHSANTLGITLNTAKLAEWITRWQHRLAWAACLDVIYDPQATWNGFRDMRELHGIDGVPSLHFGTPPSEMDRYAEVGVDFMGLGGMVGKSRPKAMRWLLACLRYARDNHPGMRFHGWGLTSEVTYDLPFFSVDSSSWSAAYRYGRLDLRDPRTRRSTKVVLDGRHAYSPAIATLLRDVYGVAPGQIATCSKTNRPLVVEVAARAVGVTEQIMRRKHGTIPAPTYGRLGGDPGAGPRIHMVNSQPEHLQTVNTARTPDGPHVHVVDAHPKHLEIVSAANGPHVHIVDGRSLGGKDIEHIDRTLGQETR